FSVTVSERLTSREPRPSGRWADDRSSRCVIVRSAADVGRPGVFRIGARPGQPGNAAARPPANATKLAKQGGARCPASSRRFDRWWLRYGRIVCVTVHGTLGDASGPLGRRRIFVSHSSREPLSELVREATCRRLREHGYEVWVNVDELRPGDEWRG